MRCGLVLWILPNTIYKNKTKSVIATVLVSLF